MLLVYGCLLLKLDHRGGFNLNGRQHLEIENIRLGIVLFLFLVW